jgi:hypothetical protein
VLFLYTKTQLHSLRVERVKRVERVEGLEGGRVGGFKGFRVKGQDLPIGESVAP